MNINACFKVGYIMKPHGLKGEVTLSLDPDFPGDNAAVDTLFIERQNRLVPYFIESISVRGDKAFVKFEEIDTPESANAISKSPVYLPKEMREKSGRGEFYDDEVIGFEVSDGELGVLGKIIEVVAAGPNRLLSVDYNGKEILIPVNGPFINSINKTKKKVLVSLPEGFLDI